MCANGCGGCGKAGSGNGSSVGTLAGTPTNPYAISPMPVATGPVSTPAPSPCVGCGGKGENIWKDILMALIVSLIVGGLFFGKES